MFIKFELLNNGVRKDLAHNAAVVTDVSWPSLAADISIRSTGVVRRPTHVRSNEHPLGKLIIAQVLVEHGEVLDLGKAIQVGCD